MKKTKKAKVARKPNSKPVRKASDARDIAELMLRDHKPLKKLIKVLKEPDSGMAELRESFERFAPLLEAHAHPEQESLYAHLQGDEDDEVRVEGFEGLTEHAIADQLVEQIQAASDEDEWRAKVKVLAELVEHHLEEEEEDMIPDLRKEIELGERVEIGAEYLRLRENFVVTRGEAA